MKKLSSDKVYTCLDNYLRMLDVYRESSHANSGKGKSEYEVYETYLMYSFNCFKGSLHSYSNIKRLYSDYLIWIDDYKKINITDNSELKNSQASFIIRKDMPSFTYEIYSFISSLKSSLDFIISAYSSHLSITNKKIDSIGKMLGLLNCEDNGLHLDIFKKYSEWLVEVNNYRNALIHRVSFNVKGGFEDREDGDKHHRAIFPIVIPRKLKEFQLDTRQIRFNEDHKYDTYESEWILSGGGVEIKKGVIEAVYLPAAEYMDIFDFVSYHIEKYEEFFEDLMALITREKLFKN